jgi:hypothetical protein
MPERLSDDTLRCCAAGIILEHLGAMETSAVTRLAPQLVDRAALHPNDIARVLDLIDEATIRVSWPDHPYVYADPAEDFDDDAPGISA